jgi:hypothetical protein
MLVRPASTRGHANHGWLDSYHSFSFADWYDPRYMGVPPLRVLNDDRIAPGTGFGAHPHRDMEIVTYPVSGALEHRDSQGNHGVIRPGEVQFMRAGTGVTHSEMNASQTEPGHFCQIWIQPRTRGLAPAYDQRKVEFHDGLAELAGGERGIPIDADARMMALKLDADASRAFDVAPGRQLYVYLIEGALSSGNAALAAGDAGVLPPGWHDLTGAGADGGHALVFDLPA